MASIRIEAPDLGRRVVDLLSFPCRIGRRKSCQLVLPSWRVAGFHAEIRRSGDLLTIVDQGSLGGTWVNGERIVEFGPLTGDDEILIAGYSLRLQSSPGPLSASAGQANANVLDGAARGTAGHDSEAGLGGSALAGPHADTEDELLQIRRGLHRLLLARMDLRRQEIRHLDAEQLRRQVQGHLDAIMLEQPDIAQRHDIELLRQAVLDEAIGLGVLEPLLQRADVTEIMVNGTEPVYIETAGQLHRTELRFSSIAAIEAVIERIVSPLGRRIDEASPMVDARLPDGSRVNAIVPPLAIRGPALTIRRFNRRRFAPADLVNLKSASDAMMKFLSWCVGQRRNMIVSGGTGSGKTTLLNILSSEIGADERVVTIEDAAELRLEHPHLVSLEARPPNNEDRGEITIRDLVRNALRMRPDRIVVGECRGGEALDMLQAMNTGHDGSLTTVHANSARDVLARLEVMVLMSGVDIPIIAIREQVSSAIDIIVQQQRGRDGVRRIVEIVEVTGMDGATIQTQPLFRYAGAGTTGRFECCGNVPTFLDAPAGEAVDPIHRLFGEPA